jgi:hypothetical protein
VAGTASRPDGLYFPLDMLEERLVHCRHARKEVVQWTVAINPARWLTLRFRPSVVNEALSTG